MHKKILTIGTASIDIIAVAADEDIEKISFTNAEASYLLLQTGRKMDAKSINSYYGGGALNAAMSLQKLGLQCDAFVKLGNDSHASDIINHLQQNNIGTQHVAFSKTEETAISVLISSHDRDPTILTHRGANTRIRKEEFPWDNIKNYDAIYVTNLSNESRDIFAPVISAAFDAGVQIISNPGIRQISNSGEDFLSCLQKINMFIINRLEAVELSAVLLEAKLLHAHKHKRNENDLNLGGLAVSIEDFLSALAKLGIALAVVTDGKDGAHLFYQQQYHFRASQSVGAIGTVGAGDAFASTLAGFWLMGYDIEKSAHYACVNAASVVAAIDAQSGLLTAAELFKS